VDQVETGGGKGRRGGARKGSGPKPIAGLRRVNVTLDPRTEAAMRSLAPSGEISEGLRCAARLLGAQDPVQAIPGFRRVSLTIDPTTETALRALVETGELSAGIRRAARLLEERGDVQLAAEFGPTGEE
jgi:hypothetical protein